MPETIILELDSRQATRLLSTDSRDVIPRSTPAHRAKRGEPALQYVIERSVWLCGADDGLIRWIRDTANRDFARRSLRLTVIDQFQKSGTELKMYDCLLLEVTLPALDKASKDNAAIRVSVQAERLRTDSLGDVRTIQIPPPSKSWGVREFEFAIDGIDAASAIRTVQSLVIKQGIKTLNTGQSRFSQLEPTKLDESNIVISLPLEHGDGFYKWNEETTASGRTRQSERQGELRYLARDKTVVLIVTLELGLISIAKAGPSLRVEMYCNRMKFSGRLNLE